MVSYKRVLTVLQLFTRIAGHICRAIFLYASWAIFLVLKLLAGVSHIFHFEHTFQSMPMFTLSSLHVQHPCLTSIFTAQSPYIYQMLTIHSLYESVSFSSHT